MEQDLIQEFVELQDKVESSLALGNHEKATEAYQALVAFYKTLSSAPIDVLHKSIAYDRLKKLHDRLKQEREHKPSEPNVVNNILHSPIIRNLSAKDIAIIVFILAIVGGVLFFKPSTVGLAVADLGNSPPKWIRPSTEFSLPQNVQTSYDLSVFFTDKDEDLLVFLATETDGVNVEVSNSVVKLTPTSKGRHEITFIASDLTDVTRVPVTIQVD